MSDCLNLETKDALTRFTKMPTIADAKVLRDSVRRYLFETTEVTWAKMIRWNIEWWTKSESALKEHHWVFGVNGGYDRETILKDSPSFASLLPQLNKYVITQDGQDGQGEECDKLGQRVPVSSLHARQKDPVIRAQQIKNSIKFYKSQLARNYPEHLEYVKQVTEDTIHYWEQRPYLTFLVGQTVYDRLMREDGLFYNSDLLVKVYDKEGMHVNDAAKTEMENDNYGSIPLTSIVFLLQNKVSKKIETKKTSSNAADNCTIVTRSKSGKRKYVNDDDKDIRKIVEVRLNPTTAAGYGTRGPPGMTITEVCFSYCLAHPDFDTNGSGKKSSYVFEIIAPEFSACGETFIKQIFDAVTDKNSECRRRGQF